MSEHGTCIRDTCDRTAADHTLCRQCTTDLTTNLRTLARLWPHLCEAVIRDDHLDQSDTHTTTPETPLPFNVQASRLARQIDAALNQWVRVTPVHNPLEPLPAPTVPAKAAYLEEHARLWRRDPSAGPLCDAIARMVTGITAALDRRPVIRTIGPCPRIVDDTPCTGTLTATTRADEPGHGTLTCTTCHTTWPLPAWPAIIDASRHRQADIDRQARAALALIGED